MKLIIGGSFQGKRAFVKSRWALSGDAIADGGAVAIAEAGGEGGAPLLTLPEEIRAVDCYHLLIRRQLTAGMDPEEALRRLLKERPELLLICDEIGNGVIPAEKAERDYREAVGRTMCIAAQQAQEVWRVFCGIGERIR